MGLTNKNRLSLTGKRWHEPKITLQHDKTNINSLPTWVETLLTQRGIIGETAIQQYLFPTLASLADPAHLADIDSTLTIIIKALHNNWPITVYGDYDVDGVCSTTLLIDFFRKVGANIDYYIPARRLEGYGLNESAIRDICLKTKLLITTDCGITAHHEINIARELGCEVIVVDHHRVAETLPKASACINPQRDDCGFADRVLCAAGVAFMLIVALRRALRDDGYFKNHNEPDVRELLDLVALATVADMVPIIGINRILVTAGLKQIASTQRVGLNALINITDISKNKITASDIGYKLGPRLNARGRLHHAGEAVELLLTNDTKRAQQIAASLDSANHERRILEKATLQEALDIISHDSLDSLAALCVYNPNWHAGVLGLVASRLTSIYHRPAVVIGEDGKGSARSVNGVDLYASLTKTSEHLIRFGGHAAAAGITIDPSTINDFRTSFANVVQQTIGHPPYVKSIKPDIQTPLSAISLQLLSVVEKLEPFGQQNPQPLFKCAAVPIHSLRVLKNEHLKFMVGNPNNGCQEAIAFGMANIINELPDLVDIVFYLERDSFGGRKKPLMRVKDIRPIDIITLIS
ncbi:MAG: single-stranded-DNA-specific exonuclease RecJ [Deltaproteobacteria bacterium]|nr:single-stranded-DNA-specific exonuclease RecJ [Deltaproteobacteria bacterium]